MPHPSPFSRGFRALRREPSVLLAEIAWRWLFGGIATALLTWATFAFLHAIEVSKTNQFLLRTLDPELMGYAFQEMFRGKWVMLARLVLLVAVGLSLLWIVIATIARSATTRVLVEHLAGDYGDERESKTNLRSIFGIQFVRVALLWIGVAAYFFSALIASRLTRGNEQPHLGAFLVLFLCMFGVAAIVLSFCNWILFLAPIFAVRDDLTFTSATIEAWRFSSVSAGRLLGLNFAHLGLRLVWIVFMSGAAFVPLGFAQILPRSVIFLAMLGVSLVYVAVADALFVARYAGYIEIAEQQSHLEPELESPSDRQATSSAEPLPVHATSEVPHPQQETTSVVPETSVPPESPEN